MRGLIPTIEAWSASLNETLAASSTLAAVFIVFLAGVLTSLTPCVYPMIPVVVTYVGGTSAGSRGRAVTRSAVYVLGMVVIYAALGAVAGLTGSIFGRSTQRWYVYLPIGLLILLLGLSMLGVWTVRIPASISGRLASTGSRRGLAGPFLTGAASGLIAAPCTAPVLGTLLVLVGRGGRPIYGAFLLFVFALGMGLLLFLLGSFSGLIASLPRAGRWTERVKTGFGVAMVALSAWFLYTAWTFW